MSEKRAKQQRQIPDHIHCEECRRPIRREDAKIGNQHRFVPKTPEGKPGWIPVKVPLCEKCFSRIRAVEVAQAEQQNAASRLVVARGPVKVQ